MTTTTTPTPSKLGIAIDLDELRELMTTYIDEEIGRDEQLVESIRFSMFLTWVSKRYPQRQQLTLVKGGDDGVG